MKAGNILSICLMGSTLVACGGSGRGSSLNDIYYYNISNSGTNTDTGADTNTSTDTNNGTGGNVSNPPGSTDTGESGGDTLDNALLKLTYDVVDAAYSDSLERLITVSSSPEFALNIIDPENSEQQTILLNYAPTTLAISPAGDSAVVGHNGAVTYIDLKTTSIIGFYDLADFNVFDLALGSNGLAYASPTGKVQWGSLKTINLGTGTLQDSPYAYLRGGAHLELADSLNALYVIDTNLSPTDINKFDLASNPPAYLYDSPYNGDYDMGSHADYGMWLTEDGKYILTGGETLFQTSSSQDEDLLYVRSTSDDDGDDTTNLIQADHSQEVQKFAVIKDNSSADVTHPYRLKVYTMPNLALDEELSVSDLDPDGSGDPVTPQFVFFNNDGSSLYGILRQGDGTYLKNFYPTY